jgi:SAM-dependent methyltransferase
MTTLCNVCKNLLGLPVFTGEEAASITTMNVLVAGQTRVFLCDGCGHLQTQALPDLERYYAEEYSINADGVDDDQLYEIRDGREVYRSEHQAAVLMQKLDLSGPLSVLDYGCAKGATLRRVVEAFPNVQPYLFDVTDRYLDFWKTFPGNPRFAAHKVDRNWSGALDVVLSFYALEHIPDLGAALRDFRDLLKPGGTLYFIVPNVYQNPADFIVADHVNHFCEKSLRTMLESAGFGDVAIDDAAHAAAFVVMCRKAEVTNRIVKPAEVDRKSEVSKLVDFWGTAKARIQAAEAGLPEEAAVAIYGAGIYGNFIRTCLKKPERIAGFMDQNRYLHGRLINGLTVFPPAELAPSVAAVFIGLNPRIAREAMSKVEAVTERSLPCIFLDEPDREDVSVGS